METSVKIMPAVHTQAERRQLAVPWFVYAVVFATTSIAVGIAWDISWHMSIGRDTFWSPPHIPIYAGSVVAGVAAGCVVLKTTFAGSAGERARAVRILWFRGPLGTFFCIWGATAMLTSAPLDDWWHGAYGLDVAILSPPHMLLALGIAAIQVGAMVSVVAMQNRAESEEEATRPADAGARRRLRALYVYTAGMLLTNICLSAGPFLWRIFMHSSLFYRVACLAIPAFLVAAARASRLRWPATATAAVYTTFILAQLWILPLFPAEPKLGPVREHLTRMVPLEFPLLLVVPAVLIDVLMRRAGESRDWLLSLLLGVAFLVSLLVVQWPFSSFLMSSYAQNWVFATDRVPYFARAGSLLEFCKRCDPTTTSLVLGYAVAALLAVVSARLGLWWGSWMRRVQR